MDTELIHDVFDTDSRFSINPTSRLITKISEGDVKLVQYDHNSERFAFEIPREVDGHDMSLCTSVVIHYINIGSTESNDGIYDVEDVQVDPEDESKVIFSWLISQEATLFNGSLNFAIQFKCVNDNGKTVYVWNTLPFTDMTVGATMDNTDSVISQRADILEQWRRTLFKPEFLEELKEDVMEELKERVDNATINDGDTVNINITGNAATATDANNAEWANSAGVADSAVYAMNANEATHAEKADIADLALSLPTYKTDFYNPMRYGKLLNIARFTFPSYGTGVQARLAISSELPYSVSGILDLHVTLEDWDLIHAELCWSSLNDDKFEDMFRIAKESDGSFGLYIKFPYTEPEADVITVTVLSKNSIYNGDFGWMYYSKVLTDDYSFPEPSENVVATSMIDSAFALKRDMSSGIECTAEGTEVALPDSADAPLKGLRVMGKTEQFKTNGYQLFDASRIGSTESAGVKFTNNGDGSFTITKADTNDTDVTTSSFQVAYSYTHEETVAMFKAGNVYIKGDATISPPLSIQERWTVDGTIKSTSVAFINGTKYITITEDELNDPTYHIRFVFYASSGTTITPGTVKPMVYQLKDDTDKFDGTWEPYTGGKPSPGINNVKSKNLFKLPKDINIVNHGITITGNAGESFVTINGTCDNTKDSSITFVASGDNSLLIKADKKYTASVRGLHNVTSSTDRILINGRKTEGGTYVLANHIMTNKPVTFPSETFPTIGADVLVNIMFIVSPGTTYNNEKVYIQIEEGETATPWMSYFEPYIESYPQPLESVGDDGSVNVKVYGKNLFNPSAITCGNLYNETEKAIASNSYGTSINSTVYNGNKIIVTQTVMGNPNSISNYNNGFILIGDYNNTLRFDEEYTLIADYKMTGNLSNVEDIYMGIQDAAFTKCTITNGKLYYNFVFKQSVANPRKRYLEIRCGGKSFELSNIMLVEGNAVGTNPEYIPFKEQAFTISTPNRLPGIPVSSDGNYTDASGQQWICDEVDFGRKLYVSRIEKIMLNGSEVWKTWGVNNKVEGLTGFYMFLDVNKPLFTPYKNNNILCSHMNSAAMHGGSMTGCGIFDGNKPYVGICVSNDVLEDVSSNEATITSFKKFLSLNNMSVIYAISPIETQLSDEQIAQYKALHTYKPNTSIQNSDNAYMAVKYAADTKAYIDNKYAELASMLTNVSSQII